MPSIVKAESNIDRQQDTYQQDKQLLIKQQREQKEQDKKLRFKQKREQKERDKQLRIKHQQDQGERDKQLRDKQQRNNWRQNNRLHDGHHNWSHQAYRNKIWHRTDHRSYGAMPFKWYQKFDRYSSDYHMERIHAREWNDRFPGLHIYTWMDRRGEGFWYRNHRIVDAILFYNDSEELVSIGFIHDGIFIMIRDDDEYYENHDSFFLSWWNRNGIIRIRL